MKHFLLLIPLLVILQACQKDEANTLLARHELQYPGIKKKYVYQSLIRLANVKNDPDFEKLIKDVDKIVLYFPPPEDSTYQLKTLRTEMPADGYETLVDVRTADTTRISLWVKESDATSHYIALMDTEKDDLILEIDGQLNLEYLSAIKLADQKSLMKLIQ